MTQPQPLALQIAATLGGLEVARLQCRQYLSAHGVDAATVHVFELVLEECVTNTLRYGYASGDTGLHVIELALALQPETLELQLTDDARPFDPTAMPDPALPRHLDEAAVGGLGLLMVKRTTSGQRYTREGGRNRLALTISRRREPEHPRR